MNDTEILDFLRSHHDPEALAGMKRFGINTARAVGGVSIPMLRKLARRIGPDHDLAQRLWDSELHEARILAGIIDEPARVTARQMDAWARDFDSWDLCDQVCNNLFRATKHAWRKADQWPRRRAQFVKRAGFTLIVCLAVHDTQADDQAFLDLLQHVHTQATDERNFVTKAVNWALRAIGKRNAALHAAAIALGAQLRDSPSRSARWISSNALRELNSQAVRKRLRKRD